MHLTIKHLLPFVLLVGVLFVNQSNASEIQNPYTGQVYQTRINNDGTYVSASSLDANWLMCNTDAGQIKSKVYRLTTQSLEVTVCSISTANRGPCVVAGHEIGPMILVTRGARGDAVRKLQTADTLVEESIPYFTTPNHIVEGDEVMVMTSAVDMDTEKVTAVKCVNELQKTYRYSTSCSVLDCNGIAIFPSAAYFLATSPKHLNASVPSSGSGAGL